MTSPYSITAPVKLTLAPDASGTFTIVNSGTQPLVIRELLGRYSPKAIRYPAASGASTTAMGHPWLRLDGPATFTLAPHSAHTVRISDQVPAGAQGMHALDIVFTASPLHSAAAAGPLHVVGAVASTVSIPLPGVAQPVTSATALPRALPASHHGGGISTLDTGAILCGAAVLAAAGAVAWRRRRGGRGRRARA